MTLPHALDLAAAATVLAYAFAAVNTLSWHTWRTNPVFCAAAIALSVGAAAVAIGPLVGVRSPEWPEVLLHIGVAAWVIADRRKMFHPLRHG